MKFKTQYLKDRGEVCPWCNTKTDDFLPRLVGITDVSDPETPDAFVNYDAKEIEIYQEWQCNICGKSWRDIYRLCDVIPIPETVTTGGSISISYCAH